MTGWFSYHPRDQSNPISGWILRTVLVYTVSLLQVDFRIQSQTSQYFTVCRFLITGGTMQMQLNRIIFRTKTGLMLVILI